MSGEKWVKIDAGIYRHRKFYTLSLAAKGLFTMCLAWSRETETYGRIPAHMLPVIGGSVDAIEVVEELVSAGLFTPFAGDGGHSNAGDPDHPYYIKGWDKWQASKERVEELREIRRNAGARGGRAKAQATATPNQNAKQNPSNLLSNLPSKNVANPSKRLAKPSKSYLEVEVEVEVEVPELRSETHPPASGGKRTRATYPEPFEKFWAAYPRKIDKAEAAKAWAKATTTTDPEAITNAAHGHANAYTLAGTEPRHIPHPTTWLNKRRWETDPGAVASPTQSTHRPGHHPTVTEIMATTASAFDAYQQNQPPQPSNGTYRALTAPEWSETP